jgi:hypothetical protein
MKIKFDGSHGPMQRYSDLLKEFFYIGKYEWDEADYGFTITLFGYSWNWLIYKNKESYLEYKEQAIDFDARFQKWTHDNSQIS